MHHDSSSRNAAWLKYLKSRQTEIRPWAPRGICTQRVVTVDYMVKWQYKLFAMKNRDVYKRQARVLKALANESRLMIVDRLGQSECTVGELVTLIGSDQSTVSKHLAVLRSHGIVEDRRVGSYVHYRLLTPCVLDFFTCATQVLEVRL